MKMLQIQQRKIPSFGITTPTTFTTTAKTQTAKLQAIFKELAEKFKHTNEIGRFDKIKAEVPKEILNSSINKALIIVEPSANHTDFRTRVLSFVAVSPKNENVKRSVCQAVGNKFAIDSVLKNTSTITAFKNFIKDSERFFI